MKNAIITVLVAVIAFGAGAVYGTKRVFDAQQEAAKAVVADSEGEKKAEQ